MCANKLRVREKNGNFTNFKYMISISNSAFNNFIFKLILVIIVVVVVVIVFVLIKALHLYAIFDR